jgi:ornithine carbamoyltransferase
LGQEEVGLGSREPVSDVARVLSGYVDCIVARVFSHQHLVELAEYGSVPVINALSDWEHPCQTLADLQTIKEHVGHLDGVKLTFIGDGNNVARSLCLGLSSVGGSFAIAAPEGYNLDGETLELARQRPGPVSALIDPSKAVRGADVVYTDVWTSMGQETEAAQRRQAFEGYTVDASLLAKAKPGAIFMHDMPAHYGEEVPPGMLEHPQSVAYQQAHNRLYAQMALLEFILG